MKFIFTLPLQVRVEGTHVEQENHGGAAKVEIAVDAASLDEARKALQTALYQALAPNTWRIRVPPYE